MFTARRAFRTTASESRFEVINVLTGQVRLITRDPGRALAVAASLNSNQED